MENATGSKLNQNWNMLLWILSHVITLPSLNRVFGPERLPSQQLGKQLYSCRGVAWNNLCWSQTPDTLNPWPPEGETGLQKCSDEGVWWRQVVLFVLHTGGQSRAGGCVLTTDKSKNPTWYIFLLSVKRSEKNLWLTEKSQ